MRHTKESTVTKSRRRGLAWVIGYSIARYAHSVRSGEPTPRVPKEIVRRARIQAMLLTAVIIAIILVKTNGDHSFQRMRETSHALQCAPGLPCLNEASERTIEHRAAETEGR